MSCSLPLASNNFVLSCVGQLFLGVIFDAFLQMRIKMKAEKGKASTPEERAKKTFLKDVKAYRPLKAPHHANWRGPHALIPRIVNSPYFKSFIEGVLVLNTVALALQYDGQPITLDYILKYMDYTFTVIFVTEMIMVMITETIRGYWTNVMHAFDGVVTTMSLLDTILSLIGCVPSPTISLLRSLRVFRIIRLLMLIPDLKHILRAVRAPIKTVVDICTLLGIFVFIYATIGSILFKHVDMTVDGLGATMGYYLNFNDIFHGMSLLFVIATGAEWTEVIHAIVKQPQNEAMSVHTWKAMTYVYFVSFIMLLAFYILNLFVMVIVDSFEVLQSAATGDVQDIVEAIPSFQVAWFDLTPNGENAVNRSVLIEMFRRSDYPIGFVQRHNPHAVERLTASGLPPLTDTRDLQPHGEPDDRPLNKVELMKLWAVADHSLKKMSGEDVFTFEEAIEATSLYAFTALKEKEKFQKQYQETLARAIMSRFMRQWRAWRSWKAAAAFVKANLEVDQRERGQKGGMSMICSQPVTCDPGGAWRSRLPTKDFTTRCADTSAVAEPLDPITGMFMESRIDLSMEVYDNKRGRTSVEF